MTVHLPGTSQRSPLHPSNPQTHFLSWHVAFTRPEHNLSQLNPV